MKRPNVYNLDTPYAQQKTAQLIADTQYVHHVRRRRFVIIMTVFAMLVIFFGFQLWKSHQSLNHVNNQIRTTQAQLTSEKKKQARLNQQIKNLNDSEYLQQLIRSKYNYAKKGETIYNFAN